MKLKFTRSQMMDFNRFIGAVLCQHPYTSRSEKLLDILVNKIRIKIRNKLDQIREQYTITLTQEEAIALEEWAAVQVSKLADKDFKFEKNLLLIATLESNRLYGRDIQPKKQLKLT